MKTIFFMVFISFLSFIGCQNEITTPMEDNTYGVQGHILDTAGTSLSGVKVYCLFDYNYIPDSTNQLLKIDNISLDSTFQNILYQNFPNPLSIDTYIRFSLHQQSGIELTVKSKLDGKIYYKNSENLSYGLYQRYFELGNNSNFKNGIYEYDLKVIPVVGKSFNLSKEMFLISNKNKPNSVSNDQGSYLFNYDEAFINDTVKECSYYNTNQINNHIITDYVHLQFSKEGYFTKDLYITLYKDILLNQDVVLEKESQR